MKNISIILVAFLLLGCNNKKKDDKGSESVAKINYDFTVLAKLKTDKEDRFQFVLKDIDNETTIEKTVVKVSEDFQDVVGKVKAKYDFEYPTTLYLGLGYLQPKTIILESLEISYKGKSHIFTPNDFEEYFTINKFVEFGDNYGELITKTIDGQHVPILGLNRKGIDLIK
ncbi:hypothetical protein [Lacinutrix algicola]|uniref:hypothetical protein n=1 Tax=Lacinutrix algicola TaxID=342954 RepID=UPI0006E1A0B5|nr:hypothetical protein [Lacinutrix algicola]